MSTWYCLGYTVVPQYWSDNLYQDPSTMPKIQGLSHRLGAKACACNSSTWEAEAGRAPPVWDLSELHRDQNKYAGVL